MTAHFTVLITEIKRRAECKWITWLLFITWEGKMTLGKNQRHFIKVFEFVYICLLAKKKKAVRI